MNKQKILVLFDKDIKLNKYSHRFINQIIIPFLRKLNDDYYTSQQILKQREDKITLETNNFIYELSTNHNIRGQRYYKFFIDYRIDHEIVNYELLPNFTTDSDYEYRYINPFEFIEVDKDIINFLQYKYHKSMQELKNNLLGLEKELIKYKNFIGVNEMTKSINPLYSISFNNGSYIEGMESKEMIRGHNSNYIYPTYKINELSREQKIKFIRSAQSIYWTMTPEDTLKNMSSEKLDDLFIFMYKNTPDELISTILES